MKEQVVAKAEKLDKVGMKSEHACFKHGGFTRFLNLRFKLAAGFLHHFLDTSRMNSAVGNKFFKRNTSDFTSYGIKARKNDRLRSIVDNEVNAGSVFERANVTSLSADYTAFHIVVGKIDD